MDEFELLIFKAKSSKKPLLRETAGRTILALL
jgi:hypothetical protein